MQAIKTGNFNYSNGEFLRKLSQVRSGNWFFKSLK